MPDIISNTSCLIALDNIGMLFILKKLYGRIYISEEVLNEFGKPVEDWIEVRPVENDNYTKILNNIVDLGESSTIALSLEFQDSLMILDDLKARKLAKNLNLKFTGLFGVILKAKEKKIIRSVQDILKKLKSVNFRISGKMEEQILKTAGEK